MEVKDAAGDAAPARRNTGATIRRTTKMLQDGYAVIADCMDHPGDGPRAPPPSAGWTHRGSTAKATCCATASTGP